MNYYSTCPVETTLNLIGNKWKLLIVRDLLSGKKRFGELKKSISATKNQIISQHVLTQNLRELESANIVNRKIYASVPPKVEYSLSELGESLNNVINALSSWGEQYQLLQDSQSALDSDLDSDLDSKIAQDSDLDSKYL